MALGGGEKVKEKLEMLDMPVKWERSNKSEKSKASKDRIRTAYAVENKVEVIPSNVKGKVSDEQFSVLMRGYSRDRTDLREKQIQSQKTIDCYVDEKQSVEAFLFRIKNTQKLRN
jgi:hypothetical protein